jgi:hypothetical protein
MGFVIPYSPSIFDNGGWQSEQPVYFRVDLINITERRPHRYVTVVGHAMETSAPACGKTSNRNYELLKKWD